MNGMFDLNVLVFSTPVHLTTLVIIAFTFVGTFLTRSDALEEKLLYGVRIKLWSVIHSALSVVFFVHFYEALHGLSEFLVNGHGGGAWYFNAFLAFIAYSIAFNKFELRKLDTVLLLNVLMSFVILINSGFFTDFPNSLFFDIEWMYTKLSVFALTLSIFCRAFEVE